MAPSDDDSSLQEAPITTETPFTLAARSVASSKPANHTRNKNTRKGIMSPKKTRKRLNPPTQRPSDDHTPLVQIPVIASESTQQEEELSEESEAENPSQTPDPGSSVSQPSQPSSGLTSGLVSFKRSRAKTSAIHEFITQRGKLLVCNRCSKTYQLSGGTGAITRHLKEKHSIEPTATYLAEKRRNEGTSIDAAILRGAEINIKAEEERRKELMGIGLDKATLEYLYLQWTIPMNIPFRQVRDKGFRTFLEYVNPVANRLLPDSDVTVKTHAEGLFAEGKQRLRHMLATALSDIHITCDMWTSPNNLGLLAVVAHFTSEKSKLVTVTLGLVELEGDHSGENQAAIVLNVLDEYEIRNKLGYIVMDNAHQNDSLIAVIADALRDQGVLYDAQERRLRCNGHVINLAVQAFLFGKTVNDYEYAENLAISPSDATLNQWRKLGPLGKLYNIIVWIMGSPQRIQSFKIRSQGLMPRRDNSTRWNSWYEMLYRALHRLKGPIVAVTNEESDLQTDLLTPEEWRILGYICDFLRNFYDATKATEGHRATLEQILPTMDFLASVFEDAIAEFEDHAFLRESLQTGFTKLLKYWNRTERSPVYIAAIVLNPTTKWTYFQHWDPEWQPDMEARLKKFWETKYRSSTGLASYSSSVSSPAVRKPLENRYFKWKERQKGLRTEQLSRDELDQYMTDPMLLADNLEGGTVLD